MVKKDDLLRHTGILKKWTYPRKTTFLTILGQLWLKNKVRFGFLDKFYVDMYNTKIFLRLILRFAASYKHEPACQKGIAKWPARACSSLKTTK